MRQGASRTSPRGVRGSGASGAEDSTAACRRSEIPTCDYGVVTSRSDSILLSRRTSRIPSSKKKNDMPIMPTAVAAVLSIPELLEAILLQLPISDLLLTAQLLNHSFRTALLSSCSLQEALFFRPRHHPCKTPCTPNPLLRKKFPPFFALCSKNDSVSFAGEKDFEELEWNRSPEKRRAYARREASWRRMLVAQPPRTSLKVVYTSEGMMGASKKNGRLEVEGGLKMGLLYDVVQASLVIPTTVFAVLWGVDPPEKEQGVYGIGSACLESDGENARPVTEPKADITLDLRNVQQCCVDEPGLGPEFSSEGYESVDFNYGEWEHRDYD